MGNKTERFNKFRANLNAAKTDSDKAALVKEFALQERLLAILNAIAGSPNKDIAEQAPKRIFGDPRHRDLTEYMLATPAERLAAYLNADRTRGYGHG